MRQLQVTVPEKFESDTREVLEDYSRDLYSSEVREKDEKAVEFRLTLGSESLDDLVEDLKDIEDLGSGELSIRVLQQEALIQKGQQTEGVNLPLSQEEIYTKAQEFAGFRKVDWGLIGLSSAIAAYGLALGNLIVVIGAMMLAPLLSPFVSSAVSLAVGDSRLVKKSFLAGTKSVLAALIVSVLAVLPFSVGLNQTIRMVASPGVMGVVLSVFVGAAAALTFTTGLRDQVAGVAVAIALVPPLAAAGIGIRIQNLTFALQAGSVAAVNILSVIVSGFATFKLIGLKPPTYYRQQKADHLKYIVPAALVLLMAIAAPIAYSSSSQFDDFRRDQRIKSLAKNYFGDDLIGFRPVKGRTVIFVAGDHDIKGFKQVLPGDSEVEVVELRTG